MTYKPIILSDEIQDDLNDIVINDDFVDNIILFICSGFKLLQFFFGFISASNKISEQ